MQRLKFFLLWIEASNCQLPYLLFGDKTVVNGEGPILRHLASFVDICPSIYAMDRWMDFTNVQLTNNKDETNSLLQLSNVLAKSVWLNELSSIYPSVVDVIVWAKIIQEGFGISSFDSNVLKWIKRLQDFSVFRRIYQFL